MSQKNKLKVYLSKSLLISEEILQPIRNILIGYGFEIAEYKNGTEYNDNLLRDSDFVLFVSNEKPIIAEFGYGGYRQQIYNTFVGKGQFSEADLAYKMNKLSFVYHCIGIKDIAEEVLLVSKLPNKIELNIGYHIKYNTDDWKQRYGIIKSFIKGYTPIDIKPFLDGYFKIDEILQYPLSPDECFEFNNKLLILLK